MIDHQRLIDLSSKEMAGNLKAVSSFKKLFVLFSPKLKEQIKFQFEAIIENRSPKETSRDERRKKAAFHQ